MAVSPVRKLFVETGVEHAPSSGTAASPVRGVQRNGNRKKQSLHKIKGFAAWSRRAEAALLRREMERASPARVSLSDDTLAPFQLRAPYETYFRHGAPLEQRQAAEAAVEEVLNTMKHSTEDAHLLASLGGTLRSAVAPPDSFKHGEASTVRGGEDAPDGNGDKHSVASRALGGLSSDAALEAWVAAAARGEDPPPELLRGGSGGADISGSGESVTVGGKQLTVSMSDDGLRDVHSGATLELGLTAHRRKAAIKQAVARALTTADGRPPWNSDAQPLYPPIHSGQLVGGVSKHAISHDSSHKYFTAGGRGPVAFMHSPADAGTRHPLRPSQTTVSSPVFSPSRRQSAEASANSAQAPAHTATPIGATGPGDSRGHPATRAGETSAQKAEKRRLAAAARRGSMLPSAAPPAPGQGPQALGMGAIAEGTSSDAAYYAKLYQAMDDDSDEAASRAEDTSSADIPVSSPSSARRPPPSIPTQGDAVPSQVATSPIRAPVRTRQRLSALERSRRAVKAALGGDAYM